MKQLFKAVAAVCLMAAIVAFAFFPDSQIKWLLVAFFWIALFNIRRETIHQRELNKYPDQDASP